METFLLEGHPFVALCDLIKHQGWADCGGAAKALVAEGLVEVDGQVETRKRCKIVAEQVVNFNGMKVVVKEGV
ncbi:ribosome-associated protein YbcJ, partial [Aeromonas media]